MDFQIGCPLCAAAVRSCSVLPDRWIQPHLAVQSWFAAERWTARVTQPARFTPFGLLLGYLRLIRLEARSLLRSGGCGRSLMIVFK